MRFCFSKIVEGAAAIATLCLVAAGAGAQTIPLSVRERAERLKPIVEWVESESKAAAIAGDVAQALDIGMGEDVATVAKIHRDANGLQYSFHIVRDHPELLILIRTTSEVSDSWKVFRTGFIERSVHVDEGDKIQLARFQSRLFDETLHFFEVSVQALRPQNPAAPDASSAAVPAGEPPATQTAVPDVPPWQRSPGAALAPADSLTALINRGTEYNLNNDYSHAMADFNEAIRLNPNSAAAFYGRAAVYYNLADYDRAIADYDHVLRLEPNNRMAGMFRALTVEKKNQN